MGDLVRVFKNSYRLKNDIVCFGELDRPVAIDGKYQVKVTNIVDQNHDPIIESGKVLEFDMDKIEFIGIDPNNP